MTICAQRTHTLVALAVVLMSLAALMVLFPPAPAHAAETGQQIDIERTASNVYDLVQKPLLVVAGVALVIGSVLFMVARGNPEKARQARVGLAAAVGGFVIGVSAIGILNLAKSLIA